MSGLVYCGTSLGDVCSAQVVGRSVNSLAVDAMRVVGRPGAVPVDSWLPPEDVKVRLMMDPGCRPDANGMSALRHRLRSWLLRPSGGELVLPDDPELTYHDAFLVDAGDWTQLFEDGECEVTFTLFDPVAYGLARVERTNRFEVGGTWRTWPTLEMVAGPGETVMAVMPASRSSLTLERAFEGGETVVIDCATEAVTVDGVDARDSVTLGSDFFALQPGPCAVYFFCCESHEIRFRERWL